VPRFVSRRHRPTKVAVNRVTLGPICLQAKRLRVLKKGKLKELLTGSILDFLVAVSRPIFIVCPDGLCLYFYFFFARKCCPISM